MARTCDHFHLARASYLRYAVGSSREDRVLSEKYLRGCRRSEGCLGEFVPKGEFEFGNSVIGPLPRGVRIRVEAGKSVSKE